LTTFAARYTIHQLYMPNPGATAAHATLRRTRRILIALFGTFLLAAVVFFFGVGRWLVVEDPPQKAHAIAALSGRMPIRALEAAKLYHAGYAPQIWLTRPAEPGASLQSMGIPYVGEDFYNLRVLLHEGVPVEAIHVLQPAIVNTADEMDAIASALAKEKGNAVIIVTSKAHTRRVRTLWSKLSAGRGRAIVRAAADDSFQASRWWRNTSDALDVVREVLGILNAWAGLPLHPAD
jgi:uncharacterized SAM-binding protein YcdF (DUF218 family)